MIILRKAKERGQSKLDWLDSHHSFSFADYQDKEWMSFGPLRVINEDFIQAGRGFDFHPHRDMEIITYLVKGSLKHQDSMGNGSIIKPGEIQRMSAGTGILHSEYNHSQNDILHLLQIWILPAKKGMQPSYEQKQIKKTRNHLVLLGARDPSEEAVQIHQNITLFAGYFDKNKTLEHPLNHHQGWLQLIKGSLNCNQHTLHAGDGIGLTEEDALSIQVLEDAEFLFFEM